MKKAVKEKNKTGSEEILLDFGKIKKLKEIKYEYLFLFIFLVLGFYLRTYHVDYPAVGYHNMKENEYIGAAKFMYYEGDYLHRKLYRMGGQDVPYFEEYPQIPLIQWASVILWKLFGMHLWLTRILIILASVGSIYVVYMLINELTKSRYLALLSSFFMAILPLGIFFGRNIQPEAPALFFMLLCAYYYVRWINGFNKKDLLYFALYLGLAGLFKYTFMIILIPLFFIFPFSKLKEKNILKNVKSWIITAIIGLSPLILWTLLAPLLNKTTTLTQGTFSRVSLFRIFSVSYWTDFWPSFNNYLADNFTWWYFWMAVIGVMLVGLTIKDKKINYLSFAGLIVALIARFVVQGSSMFVILFFIIFAIILASAFLSIPHKKQFQTFILFYAASIIAYCMILADFIKAHNYYQMPYLPLIAILSAYFLYTIGSFIKQIVNIRFIQLLPLVLILFTVQDIQAHKNAMFDTQFFGLDVGGQYLKNNMGPTERFILFGESQSVAACTYSEHLCIMPAGTYNLSQIKDLENNRNVQRIYVDVMTGGMMFLQQQPQVYDYVQNNYHIEALGLLKTAQGFSPYSFILKKGGNVSFANLSNDPITKKQPIMQTIYETSRGNLEYYLLG